MENFDAIIIGCGPAGAAAAFAAAREGLEVLALEKKSAVGIPVRCGEYVPALLLKDIPEAGGFVAQALKGLEVSLPTGRRLTIVTPGLMIDRDKFDSVLAEAASDAGAHIITSTTVTGIENNIVHTFAHGRNQRYRGRIIICADGPLSLAGSAMGNGRMRFAVGIQERLKLSRQLDKAFIYYNHLYAGGYAWLFPKGSLANVGLALNQEHSKKLKTLLFNFKRHLFEQGIIETEETTFRTGGLIPVGGLTEKIRDGYLLLAGDAAGTTNPLTGAGVAQAVISGRLAGELSACAVKSGKTSYLNWYREEIHAAFPFERLTAIKNRMELTWGTPEGDAVITDYWNGFIETVERSYGQIAREPGSGHDPGF